MNLYTNIMLFNDRELSFHCLPTMEKVVFPNGMSTTIWGILMIGKKLQQKMYTRFNTGVAVNY